MTDTSSVPPRDNSLPGDWLNSIHQGDCLQVLAQLPDESIDLVVTSPPYNLRNSTGNGSRAWPGYDGYTDDLPHEEYVAWQRQCIDEMLRVLKPTGAIFYNHTWRVQDGRFQGRADILDGFPLRQVIIWHQAGSVNRNPGYFVPDYEVIYLITKPKFRLVNSCTDGAVWRINQEQSGDFPDLPVWPVELPRRAIAATNAQIVLDPFIGSGTTAVAAVLEGRDFIGIEQSARHVEIARQRVAEALNGAVPALPPSPLPADVPEFEHPRFRGSVQVVFDHVQSVLAANGWVPAVLHQANVASDLALSKITVVRAIQALKTAGAIVVHNHGRWSTYALGNGQPQPVISSISADVTSAMSAHFEPASSPENDVTSAENDVTSAMSAHFEPASSPRKMMLHQLKMTLHRRCRLILSPHPALKMMLHQLKMTLHRRCRLILSPHPALKMMLHQLKMTLHRRCRLILSPHPALKMMLHQLKMMLHRRFGLKMTLHRPKMMLHLHPGPDPG